MILVHFQGKAFSITVIQVCAHTTDAKETEFDQFYEDQCFCLENPRDRVAWRAAVYRVAQSQT